MGSTSAPQQCYRGFPEDAPAGQKQGRGPAWASREKASHFHKVFAKGFSQSGKKLDLSHIMTMVNLTEQDKLLSTLEIEMEPADLNKQTLVLS